MRTRYRVSTFLDTNLKEKYIIEFRSEDGLWVGLCGEFQGLVRKFETFEEAEKFGLKLIEQEKAKVEYVPTITYLN